MRHRLRVVNTRPRHGRGKDGAATPVVHRVMVGASAHVAGPQLLKDEAGWLPLGGDVLVRVTGNRHLEALQRVVSQDVLPLRPGDGALALLLAPKGRFRAIMAVFAGAEESYLLSPPGRAGELARVLGTYLRLSRCEAAPVPTAGALALLGDRCREVVAATRSPLPPEGGWIGAPGALWFGRTLLGVPGVVAVVVEAETLTGIVDALAAAGARPLSEEAAELARIRVGWPAWGAELTEGVLPPEVGIEADTISYSKGCYVGQETIARMRTYGHPTRGLAGVRQLGGGLERPLLPVSLTVPGEERSRGSLTSWARHPEHGALGLALLRRELLETGTTLAGGGREFEVAPFPLW